MVRYVTPTSEDVHLIRLGSAGQRTAGCKCCKLVLQEDSNFHGRISHTRNSANFRFEAFTALLYACLEKDGQQYLVTRFKGDGLK